MSISLETESSIRRLYAQAIHLFDAGDIAWADLWAPDPKFTFPADIESGRAELTLTSHGELAGMVGQAFAMTQGRGLHHFTNFTFDSTDDGVRVRAYLMLVVSGQSLMEPSSIVQNTRIDDLVVQVGDAWLFKCRSVGAVW